MSQHPYSIFNQSFPGTRVDLNAALQALASTSSGPTAPTTTYANQLWYDTANDQLKIRNEANSGWITLYTIAATYLDIPDIRRNGSQVFSRDNIVGTVSISGGIPTGAVIQAGSGANGNFVKYADGTQICDFATAGSTSANSTWTFPAAFVSGSSPQVVGTPVSISLALRSFQIGTPTATSVDFNVLDGTAARTSTSCRIIAIGRWA